ncbi:MAG: two pore domain potassium channel family protein [Boseongicola sp.]|nr:potassium channel family protein [Silicimonas sp.]NND21250.1 two pore domain potassium channel family protein [Silicimonas sp.]NND41594.1 two pore domain potassium channel family protein [Silicimonas sp.]NNF92250.1 two pore domain potassium channel family protein [Boseongicola sp.]
MFTQLAIGSLLILASVVIAAACWWMLETFLVRLHNWAVKPPHGPKLVIVLSLSLSWTLLMMTAAVWLWATAFYVVGIFDAFEPSVYFALVAFTTLGFGDVLLPDEWRLLGGMAAANGLLMFGLLTAILVEILRATRMRQRDRHL